MGLQHDGDLWQLAWNAIHTRGRDNQDLRKVKGHATQEDVGNGISNHEYKSGNDISDELADDGVDTLNGNGLARLSSWFGQRHTNYCKPLRRVHNMIIAITLAEQS